MENYTEQRAIPPYAPAADRNGFATASLICGILAGVSFWFLYGALILGCLSIIFAALSRKDTFRIHKYGKIGIIISVVAIAVSTLVTIAAFAVFMSTYGTDGLLTLFEQVSAGTGGGML